MKITIDTHYCTREEKAELIKYLDDECWDYRFEKGVQNMTKLTKHGYKRVDNLLTNI